MGQQPVVERRQQARRPLRAGRIGPRGPVRHGRGTGPRRPVQAGPVRARRPAWRGPGHRRGVGPVAVLQHQRAQPFLPARHDAAVAPGPVADRSCQAIRSPWTARSSASVSGDGLADARASRASPSRSVDHDQPLPASGSAWVHHRALAARQQPARRVAGPAQADPVGIGQGRHLRRRVVRCRHAGHPDRRLASLRMRSSARPRSGARVARGSAQRVQPQRQIGAGAPRSGSRSASRAASGAASRARPASICASRGCSGSAASCRPWAVIRPSASSAPSPAQQPRAPRPRPRPGRRRQEGQVVGVARAPERQFQRQTGQVGGLDLGRREGGQPALLALGPEPVADARAHAPGAAPGAGRPRPG